MLTIYIDADACPVKAEVYRVAKRYRLDVKLVANSWMRVPDQKGISLQIVADGLDAADDWIVGEIQPGDIVITSDIPLADRCLKKSAFVIGPTGKPFTEDNIGQALASRDLFSHIRSSGEFVGGPAPINRSDRSFFLQQLDEVIHLSQRKFSVNST